MQIAKNIQAIQAQIDQVCKDGGFASNSITVLAASKTRSVAEIREAVNSGITHFGENFVQEAQTKVEALGAQSVTWHFIGRIQSNKTKLIARYFDWVHTLDRTNVARRLSNAMAESDTSVKNLNVCIQVNIDREPQKAGVLVEDLAELINEVLPLPHLSLRGLMAIPRARVKSEDFREVFRSVKSLFDGVASEAGPCWDTLSMGMSLDFPEAIKEGATMIRLGTSIFGPR